MTTNREWLYSLDVADLSDWFDAQHVDAHSKAHSKTEPNLSEQSESLSDEADSREKLEADASELTADYAASGDVCDALYGGIVGLLDRQVAISHREAFMRGRASLDDEFAEYTDEIAELTAKLESEKKHREYAYKEANKFVAENGKLVKNVNALTARVDELTAERDALADDLLTCNKEREEYRELFSKAITHAHEIVNLQP